MGRIGIALAGVVAAGLVLVHEPPSASACGFWNLEDLEREQEARFLIHAMHVKGDGKKKRPILRVVEGDSGLRAERGDRPLFSIKDGKLRRRGRVIGRVDGDRVTIRGTSYRIEVKKLPIEPPHNWRVKIHRDGELIARGKAMVLCPKYGQDMKDAAAARNIRRRVVYYLAWRSRD